MFQVPHAHVWCDTEDGVRLAGTMLGAQTDEALIVVHGFMGFRSKTKGRLFAESLSRRYRVYAFDLRGHGQSAGSCTGGAVEHLDVKAAVDFARARGHSKVVTIGWSLGGIAVVRNAALNAGVDGVVSISTPARWENETPAVRKASWLFVSPFGRMLARRLGRTRIDLQRDMPEAPAELVHKIAPAPVLFVHGRDDHFFDVAAVDDLYEAANEPRERWVYDRFGHAESGFDPEFSARVLGAVDKMLRG
ncbi:MAG: alpha/beta hydrolase [Actinomycetota bacterium]